MDVVKAFLNSMADTNIYIKIPPDWEIIFFLKKNTLKWAYKLLKALYSLK